MPPKTDDRRIGDLKFTENLNAFKGVAKIVQMCVTPPFRTDEGDKYYSYAIISLLLMISLTQYAPPLLVYIPIWLLLIIGKRIGADKSQHSYFGGYSRLRVIFRSEGLARVMESILVFGIGIAFAPYCEPMAEVCVGGALGLFIMLGIEMHEIQEAKRRWRDARAEMDFQNRLQRGEQIF